MGKGSSIIPHNNMVKQTYRYKYDAVKANIRSMWYIVSNKILVAHVKVPSTSVPELSYDIVIEFDTGGDVSLDRRLLLECPYRIFSNSPSFMYTYANVYNSRGMFCKWLKNKYDKKVFSSIPTTRNQYNIISYEETTYIAALYIQDMVRASANSTRLGSCDNPVKVSSYKRISIHISSFEEIMNYRALYSKKSKKDNKSKSKSSGDNKSTHNTTTHRRTKTSNTTTVVPAFKKIKSSPSTSKTKKVKKI